MDRRGLDFGDMRNWENATPYRGTRARIVNEIYCMYTMPGITDLIQLCGLAIVMSGVICGSVEKKRMLLEELKPEWIASRQKL